MPITHKEFDTISPGDIIQARILQSTFEGLDGVHRWKVVKMYTNSVSCRVDDVSHGLEVELNKLYVVSWRAIDKVVIRVPHAPKEDKPLAGIDRTRAHAMAATNERVYVSSENGPVDVFIDGDHVTPKRYSVFVPLSDFMIYYHKKDGGIEVKDIRLGTPDDAAEESVYEFTMGELRQYGLQDYKKVKVHDD